jgi:hypothetical protein
MAHVPLDQEQSERLVMLHLLHFHTLTVIQFGIACIIVGILATAGIVLGFTLPRPHTHEEFDQAQAIREARLMRIQKMAVWK